jgi:hypothetical protein
VQKHLGTLYGQRREDRVKFCSRVKFKHGSLGWGEAPLGRQGSTEADPGGFNRCARYCRSPAPDVVSSASGVTQLASASSCASRVRARPRLWPFQPADGLSGHSKMRGIGAGSAQNLVEGILIGRDGPDFRHLAIAQMHHVHGIDRDAPAAPASRDGHQRDTVLIVGKNRMKVKVERSLRDLHALPKNPKTASRPR